MGLAHWMVSLWALAAPGGPAPDVVWIDFAHVPALARESARREAQAVLARVGLGQGWRAGRAQDVLGAGELPVVLLPRDQAARRGRQRVLGACIPGRVPRVWVYLDTLAWAMGLPGHEGLGLADTARLGRAIGRIVAHEVIHAVAPRLQHAPSGLMAASFERRDLLADRLDVDADTARGLRRALLPLRASSPPPSS